MRAHLTSGLSAAEAAQTVLGEDVDAQQPALIVLAATLPGTLEPLTAQLTVLARRAPLALAGPGAAPRLAAAVQARLLGGDPVTAAENVRWPR